MITENLPVLKINKLSQNQYEQELQKGIDPNAFYLVPDGCKVKTEFEWLSNYSYVPQFGEIIFYAAEKHIPTTEEAAALGRNWAIEYTRVKIGDSAGTSIDRLPFVEFTSGVSPFGFEYQRASYRFDIGEMPGEIFMYLYFRDDGYAALISGYGAIKSYSTEEERPYHPYINKIRTLFIEDGISVIGNFFMHRARQLTHLEFANSAAIIHLGKSCFESTRIDGEYEFVNLENNTLLDRCFYDCIKVKSLTFGINAEGRKSIELSKRAFMCCNELQHLEIKDPANTQVLCGEACFYHCHQLKELILDITNTTLKGFNFLLASDSMKIKTNLTKEEFGTIKGVLSLGSINSDLWNYTSENGVRTAPVTSTIEDWMRFDNTAAPWARYKAYMDCLQSAQKYGKEKHELFLTQYDNQNSERYKLDSFHADQNRIDSVFWGEWSGGIFRVPIYGSCWLFAYYHIWNITHPHRTYRTITEFIENKLKQSPITVDSELAHILRSEWSSYDEVSSKYPNNYFNEGSSILITDLPVALYEGSYTTIGQKGEASWGVRQVLGWTGTRYTVTESELNAAHTNGDNGTWARIKEAAIKSIFAGKPVLFECVGYSEGFTNNDYAGSHAIAAIGYDASIDQFLFVDSGSGWAHNEPFTYWTHFESVLNPSEESAIWVFDLDAEAESTLIPKKTTGLDKAKQLEEKIGDIDTLLDAILIKQNEYIGGGAVL